MNFKNNLKFSWNYVKQEKKRLMIYIFCNILTIIISVFVPILSANIIVNLTNSAFKQVIFISIIIFFVEISRNFCNFLTRRNVSIIYRESFNRIQTDLGKSILKLQNKVLDEKGSGVFIQRLTSDTTRISDIFNVLTMHITSIITDIGVFVAIFIINKFIFFYLLFVIILLYFIERKRVNKRNEFDKLHRKDQEKVSSFVGEIVRGARDIKMLNSEDSFINELNKKVVDLNQSRYSIQRVDGRLSFLRGSIRDLSDLILIILIVIFISINKLTIASALILRSYSNNVCYIINTVAQLLEQIKDFNLSASRIIDIINSEEFKKEEFGTTHLDKVNGDFEFKKVSFSYNDNKVLNNLNFKINANETVAFVGKSGAGKSTIFNLLCKMYDIDNGEILIDDININNLDKSSIRSNITIINQNPYIFNLSIRDNLRLVKEGLIEEEMIEACKIACLHDFIMTLKDGYDTIIGEGGVSLSGGEKQRLAIARALVQKTEIILFDEATSALDNETQASIQEAINNMKGEYTILIIAHRLSTIINSDRILFLNNGKIEAEGTHKELLKNSPNYKHLYEAEISK